MTPQVFEHLRSVFVDAYFRARDIYDSNVANQLAEALARGVSSHGAQDLRASPGREAFGHLVDEIKRLVRERKIPATPQAGEFVRDAVTRFGNTTNERDDTLQISAARAAAELGLFFSEVALPTVELVSSSPPTIVPAHTIAEDQPAFLTQLDALVPEAAAAYRQAVDDLKHERLSYRGPANELRQALWEVLESLAPDAEVTSATDYTQEPGTRGPTQRQRAVFIARRRHGKDASETTLEAIGRLARATYTRASVSTHQGLTRNEALQVQRYVQAVLGDLLG